MTWGLPCACVVHDSAQGMCEMCRCSRFPHVVSRDCEYIRTQKHRKNGLNNSELSYAPGRRAFEGSQADGILVLAHSREVQNARVEGHERHPSA